MKWAPIIGRMQQMYDNNAMKPQPNAPKIVRKVLAAAIKRRQTLGMSQSPLEASKNTLQVNGIIYCIINTRSRKTYIGQSMNSAAHRFKQHYSACMNPKSHDIKMYSLWRKHSIDNIYILPIEKVIFEQEWDQLDAASRKRMFQHRAFP